MLSVILIILLILLVLLGLYVFVLVAPRGRIPSDERLFTAYAHRGLHGGNIPENSLAAFEKAVAEEYGIELDVQLSKDGQVMVYHDYLLGRMTESDKKVCELTGEELQQLSLAGTDEKIPTFKEVLGFVDGRVPLLVELKGEDFNTSLCVKVANLLKAYKGPYCIESFNPLLIKTMKKYLPDAFYGQLYTNVCREKNKKSVINILLTAMVFNFISRPDFIAYNKVDRNRLPVKLAIGLHRAVKFVWTVKGDDEYKVAESLKEYPIFER
ncbi:MAG: glycerophosphodiester phosphodiesterase [Ruminococcaceae bacterium]|nr:glycerophosphodiester phosphodiesterase [Oscillospiraceae bacterium]